MPTTTDILAAGRRIGEYTVERHLGASGPATAYLATDADDRPVLLRLTPPQLASDPEFAQRFEREVRVARGVEHPNLVAVVATGEFDGAPYVVQRWVGEQTLQGLIVDSGPLGVERTVGVCKAVGAALDALHAASIVHRDVSSRNVLLDDGGEAHLTGFGMVKDTRGTVLTEAGQALGSADCISPEQIRGEKIGPAADIYALGCLAHECLAGRPPFADRSGMRVLWAHLQDDPPDLGARDGVGPDVAEAVRRALAKDPTQRPRSASQFARVLELAVELSGS